MIGNGKSFIKTVTSFISNLIFFALLAKLFIVVTLKASNGQESMFGYQVKTVLSGPMEPTFQTGSIITTKDAEARQTYEIGDVITFTEGDSFIVPHRIIDFAKDGQGFITIGDANDAPDLNTVHTDHIVGKYTGFTIPYIGYLLLFMQSRKGGALLFTIPVPSLLLYIYNLASFAKSRTVCHLKKYNLEDWDLKNK